MILAKEKQYLRELAKKQLDYANLPIMKQRTECWIAHNELKGSLPMIVMEEQSFLSELLPPLQCETPYAQQMEQQLLQSILAYELIGDDKVVPDFFAVDTKINQFLWQAKPNKTYASDGIGYHIDPILEELETDLEKLKPTIFSYDEKTTQEHLNIAQDVLGDILKIKQINTLNYWNCGITQKVVDLMGMENMFCAMLDEPEKFHQLMSFVTDDIIRSLRFQEDNQLLFLNNGNDYMGSGSYCFNNQLNSADEDGTVRSIHTWGHLNSQESIGISPELYHEFVYPYYERLSKEFGLLYYGCCEPVDPFWEDSICNYANLRKVSISPWCNEEYMAEQLSGSNIIYSRKPSPNFIGIQKEFDEEAFRAYIAKTVSLTKNCKSEYIFRDIYKLHGNTNKIKRAVEIVRQEINK